MGRTSYSNKAKSKKSNVKTNNIVPNSKPADVLSEIENIKGTLQKNSIDFAEYKNHPNIIEYMFGRDNLEQKMHIIAEDDKIIMRVVYPMHVELPYIPYVAMYIVDFNINKAFTTMNLDTHKGQVFIQYAYLVNDSLAYDEDKTWGYLRALMDEYLDTYTDICRLSVGVIKDVPDYKSLLEMVQDLRENDTSTATKAKYGIASFGDKQKILEQHTNNPETMDTRTSSLPFISLPKLPDLFSDEIENELDGNLSDVNCLNDDILMPFDTSLEMSMEEK